MCPELFWIRNQTISLTWKYFPWAGNTFVEHLKQFKTREQSFKWTEFEYNGWAEMNRQDFQVADLFWEIDPRRGVGWVLIVKGVSVICNIDQDKFGLRNMKNQNFEFPSPGTTFPSAGATFPSAGTENAIPKSSATSSKVPLRLPLSKIRVAHGRPNFCFQSLYEMSTQWWPF